MARSEIDVVVEAPVGSRAASGAAPLACIAGARVQVNLRSGGAATVYANEAGATTVANPMTTDDEGRLEGWLDEGSYDLVVAAIPGAFEAYTLRYESVKGGAQGAELGYAEITSNFATASPSAVDITGLTTTVVVGTRPIIVEFGAAAISNGTAAKGYFAYILEDGVVVDWISAYSITSQLVAPAFMRRRRAPAAGSHTYKMQILSYNSGTVTLQAAADSPAWIQVTQV